MAATKPLSGEDEIMPAGTFHLGGDREICWRDASRPDGRFFIFEALSGDGGDGVLLGTVRWYVPQQRYHFVPKPSYGFGERRLREIADFIEGLNAGHFARYPTSPR